MELGRQEMPVPGPLRNHINIWCRVYTNTTISGAWKFRENIAFFIYFLFFINDLKYGSVD